MSGFTSQQIIQSQKITAILQAKESILKQKPE